MDRMTAESAAEKVLGFFEFLPQEVTYLIFDNLQINALSRLAITSKAMRDQIEPYCITSEAGFKKLIPQEALTEQGTLSFEKPDKGEEEKRYQTCRALGLMFKRSSCLYPTEERLRLMFDFIERMGLTQPWFNPREPWTNLRFTLKCFGLLIHTTIAGWDENECVVVFNRLLAEARIEELLLDIFQKKVGSELNVEYFLRSFFRLICLDFCLTPNDRAYWLSLILAPRSMPHRAKLLMIIYGPLLGDLESPVPVLPNVGWYDLSESFFIDDGLRELGLAVRLLFTHLEDPHRWDATRVEALVDELMKLPDRWLIENYCTFLYNCGEDFAKYFLIRKLAKGKAADVANFVVFLTLVTFKVKQSVNWIVRMVDEFYITSEVSENTKKELIADLPIAFSEALAESDHLMEMEEDREFNETEDLQHSVLNLLKAFMDKIYVFKEPPKPSGVPVVVRRDHDLTEE